MESGSPVNSSSPSLVVTSSYVSKCTTTPSSAPLQKSPSSQAESTDRLSSSKRAFLKIGVAVGIVGGVVTLPINLLGTLGAFGVHLVSVRLMKADVEDEKWIVPIIIMFVLSPCTTLALICTGQLVNDEFGY